VYPKVDDEAVIVLKYPKAVSIIRRRGIGRSIEKIWKCTAKGYVITVARDDVRVRKPGEEEQNSQRRKCQLHTTIR
jgi:hypothetical protein